MNLEDMKATWIQYDSRLQSTQTLNDRVVNSMISERSRSRLASIQREFVRAAALTLFWLAVIIAVLVGNPFDYRQAIEFAPVFIMALSFLGILVLIGRTSMALRQVNISQVSLASSINEIIVVYNKPAQYLKMTVMVMFSAGLMFPLSFLPRKIENVGLAQATADTLIPMAISLVLYFAAVKLGLFKDRHIDGLKSDLDELAQLKALSHNLSNE